MIPIIHELHSNGNPNAMEFHTCFPISREQKYALREKPSKIDGLVFLDVFQSEANAETVVKKEEDAKWEDIIPKITALLQEIQPENIPDLDVKDGAYPDRKEFHTNFPFSSNAYTYRPHKFEHSVKGFMTECDRLPWSEKTIRELLKIKGIRDFHTFSPYNLYVEIEEKEGFTWDTIEAQVVKAIEKSKPKTFVEKILSFLWPF